MIYIPKLYINPKVTYLFLIMFYSMDYSTDGRQVSCLSPQWMRVGFVEKVKLIPGLCLRVRAFIQLKVDNRGFSAILAKQ